jgi:heme/copper-type cytochrome/quinol oxidase subunit 1
MGLGQGPVRQASRFVVERAGPTGIKFFNRIGTMCHGQLQSPRQYVLLVT